MSLQEKTAVVVGGTRGIGRGIVEALARAGATVAFLGRDAEDGTAVAAELRASGAEVEFLAVDALELESLRAAITDVTERHGLDVLVNNAGANIGKALLDASEAEYEQLFDLNVRAAFFGMQTGARLMAASGGGSIVNMASTAATRGYRERTIYCGTKAALLMMSKAAALDMAPHQVRINCISPGAVDTPLLRVLHAGDALDGAAEDAMIAAFGAEVNPLGRVGSTAEIGAAAVYLAGDDAKWITGVNLVVDGGVSI